MTTIIDGKKLAQEMRQALKVKVDVLRSQGLVPGLVVILVGDNQASHTYVRNKERAALDVGFLSTIVRLDADCSQEDLLSTIREYNQNDKYHGILVQLPLPKQIDTDTILESIDPSKDVDGFHPVNLGRLLQKNEAIVPCTPKGIIAMFEAYDIDLVGKKVVIVGQSTIVGRPMALLCLNRGATVTVCHSRTKNLAQETKAADILIVAVGRLHFIGKEHVKEGAVVIDVGINHDQNGKLKGDVNFDEVAPIASAITPVPGGVGPMTIASLLVQTYENALAKKPSNH